VQRDADDTETLLVYADWLLEHGDPRGEVIHHQLVHGDEPGSSVSLTLASEGWEAQLASVDPAIGSLYGVPAAALAGLARRPLHQMWGLELRGELGDEQIELLASSTAFPRLASIYLANTAPLRLDHLARLAMSPLCVPRLWLSVNACIAPIAEVLRFVIPLSRLGLRWDLEAGWKADLSHPPRRLEIAAPFRRRDFTPLFTLLVDLPPLAELVIRGGRGIQPAQLAAVRELLAKARIGKITLPESWAELG
jgi:uncharacterized protein (TIGR02996 family)